jgi:hypothetical protein
MFLHPHQNYSQVLNQDLTSQNSMTQDWTLNSDSKH